MSLLRLCVAAGLLAGGPALMPPAAALAPARPLVRFTRSFTGYWLNEKNAVVEITRAADGHTYVGHYVAFRTQSTALGYQQLLHTVALADLQPPPNKPSRKCLSGTLRPTGTSQPYPVELELADAHTLRVHVKIMGLTAYTLTWKRQSSASS